jgi:hypothetical protein
MKSIRLLLAFLLLLMIILSASLAVLFIFFGFVHLGNGESWAYLEIGSGVILGYFVIFVLTSIGSNDNEKDS